MTASLAGCGSSDDSSSESDSSSAAETTAADSSAADESSTDADSSSDESSESSSDDSTDGEIRDITRLSNSYKKFVLLLNVGGVIDLGEIVNNSKIGSILLIVIISLDRKSVV